MEKDGKGPNGSAFPRAADEEEEWQMCRKIGLVRETKRCRERENVDEAGGAFGKA